MASDLGDANTADRALPDDASLAPGLTLKDRYAIEKELGRGGFGVVYLARDRQLLSKPVVIKVLQQETATDPWFQRKFRQEIEALARIDHPGVVGALDFGETPGGNPFLVMQFVEGVTLRSAMTTDGTGFQRAANILRQVGHALSAAHEKGVLHRDLKPENIMLQNPGEGEEYVKLIDFGIAAVRDSQEESGTQTSKIAGSFGYMAPEQLAGKASPSSDVYAMGIIAYEILTGRQPEMAPGGPKVKPRELRPSIPEEAQEAILKALSFYPQQRFERPRDFGDKVARALTGESAPTEVPARPKGSGTAPPAPREPESLEMAYVLFMDLVGYSAMPMDRQTQTIQQLQEIVRQSDGFQKAQASQQLVSLPTGDGMALVFFQNPMAAVHCAMEISRSLRSHPHLKLRMGVHSGPVYRIADINTNRNVAGGGINMAQRVMDCGDAGHILVSKSVADVLTQLSDWEGSLHDLGEHEVKHGVKVHILNLQTGDVGNPNLPEKLRKKAVPVATPKSKRGLYVAAGSAVALAVIIFGATQLGPGRTEPESPPPVAPSGGAPPAVPPAGSSPVAQEPSPAQPAAVVPPQLSPPAGETRRQPAQKAAEAGPPAPRETPAATAPAAEAQPTPQPPPQGVAPVQPATPSPVQRTVPPELRERMIFLAARVNAAEASLQNLERQQSRSGLSLRRDIATARERVGFLMGEAKAALSSGDADGLKRNLDLAERDVEKIEGFLGR